MFSVHAAEIYMLQKINRQQKNKSLKTQIKKSSVVEILSFIYSIYLS